jgi:hypothetical protein
MASETIGNINVKHEFMETEGFVSIIGETGSNEL